MKKKTKQILINLFTMGFILIALIGAYFSGYSDANDCSIRADCNAFTSNSLNRSYCELIFDVNGNVTLYSSFDEVCVK